MIRRAAARLMVLTAVVGALTASAGLSRAQSLNGRVQSLVLAAKMPGATVGVSIIDLSTGEVLAAVNDEKQFIPASNMKILSSGAALLVLGKDFAFKTELVVDGHRLIARGSGDPALADPAVLRQMDPPTTVVDVMTLLAGAVSKAGVSEVREIVLDDRVFDRERVHPNWSPTYRHRPYSAEVSGLNFHANVLSVFPSPSPDGPGHPPVLRLEPRATWFEILNKAKTVGQGSNAIDFRRPIDANVFTVSGEVRSPVVAPVECTVTNPPLFFGDTLAAQLSASGIRIGNGTPGSISRLAETDEALAGERTLAVISTPLYEVLRRCNVDSENLYAEALFKRAGHEITKEPGSWTHGATVIRMLLTQKLGPEFAAAATISDGSGLSRLNQVTPLLMTRWLSMLARDQAAGDTYIASLPHPGQGTLKSRFSSGPKPKNTVSGKSGYIEGVRTLSGYLIDESSGRKVAFSVLINGLDGNSSPIAMRLHEDIVRVADKWLTERVMADGQPKVGG